MKRTPVFLVVITLAGAATAADAIFGDEVSPNTLGLAPVQTGAPPAVWDLHYDPVFDEQVNVLGFDWVPGEHHKWALQLEHDPDVGGWRQAEIHLGEYLSADGLTGRRPISATVRLDNHLTKVHLSGQVNFLSEDGAHPVAQVYWGGAPVMEMAAGGYLSLRQGGAIVMRDTGDVLRSVVHMDGDVAVVKAGRAEGLELRNANWQPAVRIDDDSTTIMSPSATWQVETFPVADPEPGITCEERVAALEERVDALEAGLVALGLAEP